MYKNPYYKKTKGSFLMMISCGSCKRDIAKYQKVGKGNVLRLHIERIIEGPKEYRQDLKCPNCGNVMGHIVFLERENEQFYKMIRSTFNTRILDY